MTRPELALTPDSSRLPPAPWFACCRRSRLFRTVLKQLWKHPYEWNIGRLSASCPALKVCVHRDGKALDFGGKGELHVEIPLLHRWRFRLALNRAAMLQAHRELFGW